MQQLRINEIFFSIQGESTRSGIPTTFIRLSGCPLRCTYCDTEYAFKGGDRFSIEEILAKISTYPSKYITVTGGEPLAQPLCFELIKHLADADYKVSLETSGAFDLTNVDPRTMIVMDLKTPTSGEVDKNLFSNLEILKPSDQIKIVICNEQDYIWARELIREHRLTERLDVLFSPSWGQQDLRQLANWILEDGLEVRFQVQLHKVVWPNSYGPGV